MQLMQWIKSQHSAMIATLVEWARINSGSYNFQGLEHMRGVLINAFAPLEAALTIIEPNPITEISLQGEGLCFTPGKIISLKKRPEVARQILLCGHMDSVYGSDHPFQDVTWENDNYLKGPAVADMKGGLLVMLYALLAFEQSDNAHQLGWEVIINADEEIGSPGSAFYLEAAAKQAMAGLVFEPAMTPEGVLAGERKGNGKFTLIAKGKAAHAGRDFYAGRNAICFLAEVITAINLLNKKEQSLTINIGKIAGGNALNMVPDLAIAQLDVRVKTVEEEHQFLVAMQTLIAQFNQQEGFHLEMTGHFGRKPKPITPDTLRLFELVKKAGNELDLTIEWRPSGGCCDGNNLAAQGLPVVDTLGVRGGKLHSSEEFILVDSLVERAQLTAALLQKLADGEFQWSD